MQVRYSHALSSCGQTGSNGVGIHFQEQSDHNPGTNRDVAFHHGHAYRGLPSHGARDKRSMKIVARRKLQSYIGTASSANPDVCWESRLVFRW